jgi:hypothetical protein
MYWRRQRRHLYYGGELLKYYLTPSPPQFSLHRRAALTTNSNGSQYTQKGKGRGGGAVYVAEFFNNVSQYTFLKAKLTERKKIQLAKSIYNYRYVMNII